jgi:hypothetical protein
MGATVLFLSLILYIRTGYNNYLAKRDSERGSYELINLSETIANNEFYTCF